MNAEQAPPPLDHSLLEITLPAAMGLCRLGLATMINQLHHARDKLMPCICNSGRRSLTAASLLRLLGGNRNFNRHWTAQ